MTALKDTLVSPVVADVPVAPVAPAVAMDAVTMAPLAMALVDVISIATMVTGQDSHVHPAHWATSGPNAH